MSDVIWSTRYHCERIVSGFTFEEENDSFVTIGLVVIQTKEIVN